MAARRERGLLDPDAGRGNSPFDHHIYVIASDGDIEEGVTSRGLLDRRHPAARQPDRLSTTTTRSPSRTTPTIALTEDVAKRYEAYGWHVQVVERRRGRHRRPEGRARRRRPRPSPAVAHRAEDDHRLARAERSRTPARPTAPRSAPTRWPRPRRSWASTPTSPSRSPTPSSSTPARLVERGQEARAAWDERFDAWASASPSARSCSTGCRPRGRCPPGWATALPTFERRPEGRRRPARPPAR